MEILNFIKKYWYMILLILAIILLFFPYKTEYSGNFKIYHSILDFGFADSGIFSALLIGMLSFFATIYTNDKNLKFAKKTILPDNYLEFMIHLDYHYTFFRIKYVDPISNFIQLLILWNKFQKVFKLTYPKLYDSLIDYLSDVLPDPDSNNFEKNA